MLYPALTFDHCGLQINVSPWCSNINSDRVTVDYWYSFNEQLLIGPFYADIPKGGQI